MWIRPVTLTVALACAFACALAACSSDTSDTAEIDQPQMAGGKAPAAPEPGAETPDVSETPDVGDPAETAPIPADQLPSKLAPELKLLPQLPGGIALFTDMITLQPGDDVTYCTYIDGTLEDTTYIHNVMGSQSRYGHHILLYFAAEPEEPGTRACGSMEKYGQVIGGSAGETGLSAEYAGNIASKLPAGAQLVLNHHWINYGEEPAEVQGMMMTVPPTADEQDIQVAKTLAIVNTKFELPPGTPTTVVAECVFKADVPAFMVAGHAHEWGTWVKGERVNAAGETEVLFDHAWSSELAVNPKLFYYPGDDPLVLKAGETVRVTCDFMNTTSSMIGFPREMCILPMFTLSQNEIYCLDGNWIAK